jgi:RNA binding exosome subunit
MRNVLPKELLETVQFEKANLTGYYGNPITLYETRIRERAYVQRFFENLSAKMSVLDKEVLNGRIRENVEKGNLYLRLDKQSAYLDKIKLHNTDPIHLRIHFKNPSIEDIVDVCRRFGLLP